MSLPFALMEPPLTACAKAPAFYQVGEEFCVARPGAPVVEKSYAVPAVGYVLSGLVEYRSGGTVLTTVPGTLICGNSGEQFSCRHGDAQGSRRLVAIFNDMLLQDVASDCGFDDASFHTTALPPGRMSAAIYGQMRKLARPDHCGETVFMLAAAVLRAGRKPLGPLSPTPRSRQRILSVVSYLGETYDQPHTLESLAKMACLSRHHFLRLFKQITGQTPNQYLIAMRLRSAADMLVSTRMPISEVAFTSGFRDISHFNGSFRAAFGCSPRQWRNA